MRAIDYVGHYVLIYINDNILQEVYVESITQSDIYMKFVWREYTSNGTQITKYLWVDYDLFKDNIVEVLV